MNTGYVSERLGISGSNAAFGRDMVIKLLQREALFAAYSWIGDSSGSIIQDLKSKTPL